MIPIQAEFTAYTNCIRFRITAPDGTGAQVTNEDKWLKQADLSSITYTVYDVTDQTAGTPATLTISSVIYDTPQTNWSVDGTGYNFQHLVPPGTFPTEPHQYEIVYLLTTTGGNEYPVAVRGPCLGLDGV